MIIMNIIYILYFKHITHIDDFTLNEYTQLVHVNAGAPAEQCYILKVTVPKKTIGQSSFAVAGPQMWNDLPIDVRSAQSLTLFRKHLKTCLFRRHYLA